MHALNSMDDHQAAKQDNWPYLLALVNKQQPPVCLLQAAVTGKLKLSGKL